NLHRGEVLVRGEGVRVGVRRQVGGGGGRPGLHDHLDGARLGGDAASERLSAACAHAVVVRGVQAQGGVQQLRTVRDGQHGVLESESHFGVQDGAKVGGALELV